ncbi:MAG: hypothetical protein LBG43_04770 [Treponema sp.]|nr:hypothetical protein [Treponema sp.]
MRGFTIFLPLCGSLALSSGERGAQGDIRALPLVFFALEIISNVLFSFGSMAKPAAYIIANGILALVYILIAYAVSRALK